MNEVTPFILNCNIRRARENLAARIKQNALWVGPDVPPNVRDQRALQYADAVLNDIERIIIETFKVANETVV